MVKKKMIKKTIDSFIFDSNFFEPPCITKY